MKIGNRGHQSIEGWSQVHLADNAGQIQALFVGAGRQETVYVGLREKLLHHQLADSLLELFETGRDDP